MFHIKNFNNKISIFCLSASICYKAKFRWESFLSKRTFQIFLWNFHILFVCKYMIQTKFRWESFLSERTFQIFLWNFHILFVCKYMIQTKFRWESFLSKRTFQIFLWKLTTTNKYTIIKLEIKNCRAEPHKL